MQEGPQETLTVALVRDSAKTEVEVGEAQGKNVVALDLLQPLGWH
jgi:hypothetical protein